MAWRLGDTSWRKSNQIGLYTDIFFYIAEHNKGRTFDEIYKYAYNNKIKSKPTPSKGSDVNLLLKTLRWFNLVKTAENTVQLTKYGHEFYELMNNNEWSKSEISKFFKFNWIQLCWFSIMLKWTPPNENVKVFSQLLAEVSTNSEVQYDWLVEWTSGNEDDLISEDWTWEKLPKGINLQSEFENCFLYSDLDGMCKTLFAILNYEPGSLQKVFKQLVIKVSKDKIKLPTKLNGKINWSKIIDQKLKMKITELVFNYGYNGYRRMLKSCKNFITARDEYLNLNLYWLTNTGMFEYKNETLSVDENVYRLLSYMNNFEQENPKLLFVQHLLNEHKIALLVEELLPNVISEDVIPYTHNDVNYFFDNYLELSKRVDLIIDKFNLLTATTLPTIVEYFSNLKVFYLLADQGHNINFRECCRTMLDSEGKPIRFASGGDADGIFKLKSKNIIVEATTNIGETQQIKAEEESVVRHAWSVYTETEKPTIAIFIAPEIANHFITKMIFGFVEIPKPNSFISPKDKIAVEFIQLNNQIDFKTISFDFEKISHLNEEKMSEIKFHME